MSKEQHLTFFIGREEYAVGILRVREIIEYTDVTRVPGVPAHIRGVINLRGSVVPVVDLGSKFGAEHAVATRTSCIVIVETHLDGQMLVAGVLADSVSQVVDISSDEIEPPPPTYIRWSAGSGDSGAPASEPSASLPARIVRSSEPSPQ